MEDRLPTAIAMGNRLATFQSSSHLTGSLFSCSFTGKGTIRENCGEIQERKKKTLSMTHLWIKLLVCICSLLLCDNQIDLHTKTKRSRSGNPTPMPCNRTDLAIWPLSSGTGIIGLMALIITALLLICHWLCAVDSHSVIDTCSKPVLYPTSVGECWWLPVSCSPWKGAVPFDGTSFPISLCVQIQ